MQPTAANNDGRRRIFHVSSRENIMTLRDEILRMHGYEVQSTIHTRQALDQISQSGYDLVLIDVEADTKVQGAQDLCETIKKVHPGQHIAFVCNYRVGIESDCPDEIIRAEFNPEALVRGVEQALGHSAAADKKRNRPVN